MFIVYLFFCYFYFVFVLDFCCCCCCLVCAYVCAGFSPFPYILFWLFSIQHTWKTKPKVSKLVPACMCDHYSSLSTGSTKVDPALHNSKIVDGTSRIKSNKQTEPV